MDYSNCRCEAVDGFEATRVDSYAEAYCLDMDGVPDEEHKQTRYCDPEGRWGAVDQSQCPVKWCPTVDSWYKVPVGHTPTIVRLGCMSGERWRQCNLNGVWGPVNTDNCDCVYSPSEGAEALLRPGDSYSLACSLGERVYKCNEESGYFDPVDLSSCLCEGDGRFATSKAGELASAGCDFGTATRFCSLDGFWEEVDNSHCSCPASGVWPQSEVGQEHSVLCDVGFRSRVCNGLGHWEEAVEDTCKCVNERFEARLGETVMEACEEGEIRHVCQTGHFEEPDRSTCFCAMRKEFDMLWNRVPAGASSPEITCMNGARVARGCGLDTGKWEDLDVEACRCTKEEGWTEAGVGEYSYGSCSGHSKGVSRRMCYGTQWGLVDESMCVKDCRYDGGDGAIQYVPVGETLNVTCYVNLDGARSYECRHNEETNESELVLVSDTCARLSCESDLEPIYVDVGNSETRPCIEGFTGSRTRTCLQGGVWSDYDLSGCQPILCKPTTRGELKFGYTLAGVMAEAECPAGYSGAKKLLCNLQGEWEGEVVDDCQQNFCPAEGEWPSIPALSSHTAACPAEYVGTWTRACLADGTWEEAVIPESCVPVPPVMKTIPFEGMTHVSRTPSVSLFTSIAIRELSADCPVSIVSVENPEEAYTLAVNATKTLMKGRYNNGGVFADFVLPADADVYDVSNYLRYGEYKVVFEPCWRALNNALVPDAALEVKFHTTAIPPSAPTHLTLQYLSNAFEVHFQAPQFVDEPFPVTGYYLSFQPPVLPEVRVDATATVFGPFPYVPGHVTLLVRAENAYGLSSPDVEVAYDFDDILMDAAHLRLDIDAPTVSLVRQVKVEGGVEVTVAVGATEAMAPFAGYFDVTCNDEALPKITSAYATEYTLTTALPEVTVACRLALGGAQSAETTQTFAVEAQDAEYGALALTAAEETALRVKLSWTRPALFSAQPIKAYAVQCKRVGEVYEQTQYTTAESIVVDARPYAPGPMVCRAAAVSSMEASVEGLPWSEATVEVLHVISPEEVTVHSEAKGTEIVVRVEAAYCVDVTCTVQSTLQSATQTCEGQTAVVVLSGLQLGTEYQVAVSSQAAELSEVLAIATAAEQENVVELAEARVFAHSAAVEVTLSVPDRVYCTAHTQPVHAEALLEKLAGGMLSDLLVPQAPATTATVVLTDLAATTAYSVTCVTVLSHTVVSKPVFFTTVAEEAPLTVVAVSAAGDRRDYSLDLLFDSRVELEEGAALAVSCGGRREILPIVVSEATQPYVYAVHAQLFPETVEGFKAGARCALRFASLSTVRRYGSGTLLSATPFPGGEAAYAFTVTTDGVAPVVKAIVSPSNLFGDVAALATTTETLAIPERFAYTVQCSRLGVATATHAYTEANGRIVQSGAELLFRTGFLPDHHDCQLVIAKHLLQDAKGNHATCAESEGNCVLAFSSRSKSERGKRG